MEAGLFYLLAYRAQLERYKRVNLIDIHDAANLMDVPVVWVDGMIKQGLLTVHAGPNSTRLIDEDEIIVKRYASKEFEVPSMQHIQLMLKKIIAENPR